MATRKHHLKKARRVFAKSEGELLRAVEAFYVKHDPYLAFLEGMKSAKKSARKR